MLLPCFCIEYTKYLINLQREEHIYYMKVYTIAFIIIQKQLQKLDVMCKTQNFRNTHKQNFLLYTRKSKMIVLLLLANAKQSKSTHKRLTWLSSKFIVILCHSHCQQMDWMLHPHMIWWQFKSLTAVQTLELTSITQRYRHNLTFFVCTDRRNWCAIAAYMYVGICMFL